jgi:CRISPR-associated protein Csx14
MSDCAPVRSAATAPVLIVPLGSKPQLTTIALDLLQERGESIGEVVAIHTTLKQAATRLSLVRLADEFARLYPAVRLRAICLCSADGSPLDDVDSEVGVREAFRVLYREIKAAKQAGRRVHLSITGGRKTLAVFGVAAAQLLFDEGDCAWHIVSRPELIASQALHPTPGQAQLMPVPVLRWSQISPVLTELTLSDDPFEAVEIQERLRRADALRLPRSFVRTVLTGAESQVVRLVVCEGLPDRQIASRLGRSPKTVGHQLSAAYGKAVAHFAIEGANRHALTALLATYYALEGGA